MRDDRMRRTKENGDTIDPKAWGQWTGSVKVHRAMADEVVKGMPSGAQGGMASQAAAERSTSERCAAS